ncbi:zinc finger protein 501-like [Cylas formicarius]|uniref:zinc finger protein 501-like n=1 Tax=Cylas formicarius TaxID=197179 RepID=UPI0029588551|nr:zinc finger protein 501-like [Cylas formicarius]XP_060520939.1 zinc finger protein 501-like [Cylas formicarius]XP_060520940.1 zinc finger protein 501-like [Cylas formicarius]
MQTKAENEGQREMENEECRICLTVVDGPSVSVQKGFMDEKTVLDALFECASLQISEYECNLPQHLCDRCYSQLRELYEFRQLIIRTNKALGKKYNESCSEKRCSDNIECRTRSDSEVSGGCCREETVEKQGLGSRKKNSCSECGKNFRKPSLLKMHYDSHHLEKKFNCEQCPKRFGTDYLLQQHRRIHTGERPFRCEICGKAFTSRSTLCTHRKIHGTEKTYMCEFCSGAFLTTERLKSHIKRKHTGPRERFLCEICSGSFSEMGALARHKKDVHDEKEMCPICNKSFGPRILKEHLRRHREKELGIVPPKPYVCEVCGQKFQYEASRKRHMTIHEGAKPYKCGVCGKSFNQQSTLTNHNRIHSQEVQFGCNHCAKRFRYKHHLKMHVLNHHKIVNPPVKKNN